MDKEKAYQLFLEVLEAWKYAEGDLEHSCGKGIEEDELKKQVEDYKKEMKKHLDI